MYMYMHMYMLCMYMCTLLTSTICALPSGGPRSTNSERCQSQQGMQRAKHAAAYQRLVAAPLSSAQAPLPTRSE